MLIKNSECKSELFNALSELGVTCTENAQFQKMHAAFVDDIISYYPISYDDIERVGYLYPHFRLPHGVTDVAEVWVNDEYIPYSDIQWIQGYVHLYGILPRHYDPETTKVKVLANNYVADRYSNVMRVPGNYMHTYVMDLTKHPFCDLDDPVKAVYCMVDGKLAFPEVKRVTSTTIEFTCKYTYSIDMYVCTHLVGIFQVKANQGFYIDNIYSKRCYYHVIVDDDPSYPIDARFYPMIMVDKDCTIRVYSDASMLIPRPELTRLMLYPEFIDIEDPYNTDNEYLNSLVPTDTIIQSTDTDEEIIEKFKDIAPWCYRVYEGFPRFQNEVSDFLILDNHEFGNVNFQTATVKYRDGSIVDQVISRIPFEEYRDILFYGNHMYHNYKVAKLKRMPDRTYIESPDGTPTYTFPDGIDPKRLTLIKFNAAEDTVINNIGEWIDVENMVKLHIRLNRFYRNLMVLHGDVDGEAYEDKVRVSTVPPSETDKHLWFELLVNAVPEMFEQNPNLIIKSFGLDPSDIPEELRNGLYSLNLKPDEGRDVYTELLTTYFDIGKRHRDYLILQNQETSPDPRIQEFDHIIHGPVDQTQEGELNVLHIDNQDMKELKNKGEYTASPVFPPDGEFQEGDLYAQEDRISSDNDSSDSGIDDLLDGVYLDSPDYSLDTIQYMDPVTGRTIDGSILRSLTIEQKIDIILRYIKEGTDEEKENTRQIWEHYVNSMNEEVLDMAVYKVLLTDFIYNLGLENLPKPSDDFKHLETPYVVAPEAPDVDIGTYWVQLDDNASPIIVNETKKKNIKYILSLREPDVEEIGTFWINIPAVTLQEYIEEIISMPLTEASVYLPEGFYQKVENDYDRASVVFDYGAHGVTEGGLPIFDEVRDDSLHEIQYGELFDREPRDGDIWYEFLDDVDNRVCYSDTSTMVIRVDERLVLLEFDHDNITAFMFDDIVLNFRGKLSIRYIAILVDLINSGVIDLKDVNIFYRRLITGKDQFDPGLRRLYTGRSHVVSTAKIDTLDYSITYSTNIGRYHIDYTDKDGVSNRERESAYRLVINYSERDIALLEDRMMLFVNGRYIPRNSYEEIAPGKIQLKEFKELIDCVDILYSKHDEGLSKLKKVAIDCWVSTDTSVFIQRPKKSRRHHMHPIHVHEHTLQGYYDVLLNEYIFNGKLLGMLSYAEEHPDEAPAIIRDLKQKFHDIGDVDIVGMDFDSSRIIIPAFGRSYKYEIKEGNS